jgi:hypothetical protein
VISSSGMLVLLGLQNSNSFNKTEGSPGDLGAQTSLLAGTSPIGISERLPGI